MEGGGGGGGGGGGEERRQCGNEVGEGTEQATIV